MSRAVFDYTKEVLEKVSFNSELFYREVDKAVKNLLPYEIEELKIWLNDYTLDRPELRNSMDLIVQKVH
jgi:DNA replication protein DnaD